MADEEVHEKSDASFNVYMGEIDQRIERILWHLEAEPMKDIAAEIDLEFDFAIILETREKLFERAVTLDNENKGKMPSQGESATANQANRFIVDPWQLIKRRMSSLAAIDLCEIYRFLIGVEPRFPTRILRRKPLATEKNVNKISVILDPIVEREELMSPNTTRVEVSTTTIVGVVNTPIPEDVENAHTKPQNNSEHLENGHGSATSSEQSPDLCEAPDITQHRVTPHMSEIVEPSTRNVAESTSGSDTSESETDSDTESSQSSCKSPTMKSFSKVEKGKTYMNTANRVYKESERSLFYNISEEGFYEGEERYKGENDDIHIDMVENMIVDNFTSDLDMHPIHYSGNLSRGNKSIIKSLESIQVPPILHIGQCPCASPGQPGLSPKQLTTPKPAPKRDSSLLEISHLSQASFVREILEIHDRIISSSPIVVPPAVVKQVCKTRNMATQTEPNISPDSTIRRSEFECRIDYLERALVDHERRLRSFEVWQERIERRVGGIDAEHYNSYSSLRAAHDSLTAETANLRNMVKCLLNQAKENGCSCTGCGNKKVSRGQRDDDRLPTSALPSAKENMRASICLPVKVSSNSGRRQDNRDNDRGVSTYESLMRAASKVTLQNLPASDNQREDNDLNYDPNFTALPQRLARKTRVKGPVPKTPSGPTQRTKPPQTGGATSTPATTGKANLSWVDIGNDEDKVVDDFIASVVIQDGKCMEGDTPSRAENPVVTSGAIPKRPDRSNADEGKSRMIPPANPKNVCLSNFPDIPNKGSATAFNAEVGAPAGRKGEQSGDTAKTQSARGAEKGRPDSARDRAPIANRATGGKKKGPMGEKNGFWDLPNDPVSPPPRL